MLKKCFPARALLLAAAAGAAIAAPNGGAQTAPASMPDPAHATAPVPPVRYTSPLAGYKAFADMPMKPWRQANDTAAGIGGWRAYAREAQQPPPAAPAASAPQPQPQPQPHHHHHRTTP